MKKLVIRLPLASARFALLLILSGCAMPAGMNDNCDWPVEQRRRSDQAHLVADVKVVEELALRYADTRFDSRAAHGRLRGGCEAKLFEAIAQSHGITMSALGQARDQLDQTTWDAPVHVPMAVLLIAAAILLANRIRARFPHDEKAAAVMATVFTAVGVGIAFVVVGHLWDGVVEMIRVGNTHMSYRAGRLGWREHTGEVFGTAVLLFSGVVFASYRRGSRYVPPRESQPLAGRR